ncbi:MAG: hypothetical protein NVSMB64_31030 [Candidatus Velthaea sp.]
MVDDENLTELEIEPEALRAAEFMQAQMILDTMAGKTVKSAVVEDTRISVTTTDGTTYFFYGFMGERLGERAEN